VNRLPIASVFGHARLANVSLTIATRCAPPTSAGVNSRRARAECARRKVAGHHEARRGLDGVLQI
jgi:hypothetical protein